MTSLRRLKSDREPVVCGVCRRVAIGIGYVPNPGAPRAQPVLWLCGDEICSRAAKTVYAMSEKQFDAYEIKASDEAGEAAGAYLDEIGETDLASLSSEQWIEFRKRLIFGFEAALRRQFTEHEAPF